MNSKKAKKLRKYVRKEVDANLGEGMQALQKIVRSRPRFIPKAIWIILYMPLFKFRYIKLIYKYIA